MCTMTKFLWSFNTHLNWEECYDLLDMTKYQNKFLLSSCLVNCLLLSCLLIMTNSLFPFDYNNLWSYLKTTLHIYLAKVTSYIFIYYSKTHQTPTLSITCTFIFLTILKLKHKVRSVNFLYYLFFVFTLFSNTALCEKQIGK